MDFGLLLKTLPTRHYCGKESEVLSARSLNLASVFKDFVFGTIAPTENTKVDVDLDDLLYTIAHRNFCMAWVLFQCQVVTPGGKW